MRPLPGPRLVLLVLAVVLAVLVWKVAAPHLFGNRPVSASHLSPAQVRAACLNAFAHDLDVAAVEATSAAPTWSGRHWTWTSAAQVEGDSLRFACAVGADGRAIVRVLN